MEKEEMQNRMLCSLRDDFLEGDIPAKLFLKDETDGVTDILRVALEDYGIRGDDALGEFFFLEWEDGAPDVLYFSSVITLEEEMENTHLPELYEAMAKLNFYLPAGCFAVNAAGRTLVFKLMAQIPAEQTESEILRQMNITAAHALELAEPYAGILEGIARGHNELAEIMMLLPEVGANFSEKLG